MYDVYKQYQDSLSYFTTKGQTQVTLVPNLKCSCIIMVIMIMFAGTNDIIRSICYVCWDDEVPELSLSHSQLSNDAMIYISRAQHLQGSQPKGNRFNNVVVCLLTIFKDPFVWLLE